MTCNLAWSTPTGVGHSTDSRVENYGDSASEGTVRSADSLRRGAVMGRAGLEPATLGLKVPCSTS